MVYWLIKELLKEGVEAVLDAIKEKPSTYSKYISASTFEKILDVVGD